MTYIGVVVLHLWNRCLVLVVPQVVLPVVGAVAALNVPASGPLPTVVGGRGDIMSCSISLSIL